MTIQTARDATFADVIAVLSNLSVESDRELRAIYGPDADHPTRIAYETLKANHWERVLSFQYRGKAQYIAIVHVDRERRMCVLGGFGSRGTRRVAGHMIEFVTADLIPGLLARDCQGMLASPMVVNTGAQRLLELMGARPGDILPRAGRNGEAFQLWSWTQEDLKRCATSGRPLAGS